MRIYVPGRRFFFMCVFSRLSRPVRLGVLRPCGSRIMFSFVFGFVRFFAVGIRVLVVRVCVCAQRGVRPPWDLAPFALPIAS